MRKMKYIKIAYIKRIHELRLKGDQYYIDHKCDVITWSGKYPPPDNGTQGIWVNGLSTDELQELRMYGFMPRDEYFDLCKEVYGEYKGDMLKHTRTHLKI